MSKHISIHYHLCQSKWSWNKGYIHLIQSSTDDFFGDICLNEFFMPLGSQYQMLNQCTILDVICLTQTSI